MHFLKYNRGEATPETRQDIRPMVEGITWCAQFASFSLSKSPLSLSIDVAKR